MKKIIYTLLGAWMLLTACFKDEGNYDYKELNGPHWVEDFTALPKKFIGRAGTDIALKGSEMFVWDQNPEERAKQVRYEWEFNGKIVSEELDAVMPVSEFMQKAGFENYDNSQSSGRVGTFRVIEKETDITFMAKVQIFLRPLYNTTFGDWFVLADDNGKVNLASIRGELEPMQGGNFVQYKVQDHAYEKHNNGAVIPGKPINMSWSLSPHIGTQGAITVLTDQVAYELRADDLAYSGDLKDMFLDGAPADFQPICRADIDKGSENMSPSTFLLNKDGKVYTRIMSRNYLGGKFLSEPYLIDNKGYNISLFGHSLFAGNIPFYDEKNRRIVLARQIAVGGDWETISRINIAPLKEVAGLNVPVYEFPQGTKMLKISPAFHINENVDEHGNQTWGPQFNLYTIVYTDANQPGKTFIKDFKVNEETLRPGNAKFDKTIVLNKQLDEDSQILISAISSSQVDRAVKNRIFYSVGNELFYITRGVEESDTTYEIKKFNFNFDSKITSISLDAKDYFFLMVGCENGDVFMFMIAYQYIDQPFVYCEGRISGKVMKFKQLATKDANTDNF